MRSLPSVAACRALSAMRTRNSISSENAAVHQRLAHIGFDEPVIVDHAGEGAEVHQAMQQLPALDQPPHHRRVEVIASGTSMRKPRGATVM